MGKRRHRSSSEDSTRRTRRKHRHRSCSSDNSVLRKDVDDLKSAVAELTQLVKQNVSQPPRINRRSRSSSRSGGAASDNNVRVSKSRESSVISVASGTLTRNRDDRAQDLTDPETRGQDNVLLVDHERPLNAESLALLGAAPQSKAIFGPKIHSELASRWTHLCKAGLPDPDISLIRNSYPLPENCFHVGAPKLNPEVEAATSDYCLERDKQLSSFQADIGTAVAALGLVSDELLSSGDDSTGLLKPVSCAAQILLNTQFRISKHRRKLITPKQGILNKIAESSEIDEYLFGEDLRDRVKASEDLLKSGQAMLKPPTSQAKGQKSVPKKGASESGAKAKALNLYRPLAKYSRYQRQHRPSGRTYPKRR